MTWPPFAPFRLVIFVFLVAGAFATAQDETAPKEPQIIAELRDLYHAGDYKDCVKAAAEEELLWRYPEAIVYQVKSLQALGRYEEALEALDEDAGMNRSARGQLLRYETETLLGQIGAARLSLSRVSRYVGSLASAEDVLAYGRSVLLRGAEPKIVLDNFYNRVLKKDPKVVNAYLYSGELALDKYDYKLAAEKFRAGLKIQSENVDLQFGLVRSFFDSDRPYALELMEKLLKQNPHHAPTLLLLAEHHVLLEDFKEAEKQLEKIGKVNSRLPALWSQRAVIAHLNFEYKEKGEYRKRALKDWKANPEVDYQIGLLLSKRMRFEDSTEHLKQALKFDPNHLPTQIQLAQNLLRLGEEEEAMPMLEKLQQIDPYNVSIYNLLTLFDEIAEYKYYRRDGFTLRMETREAEIYGDQVAELLERAQKEMHPRYGFEPSKPVLVEFFPEQSDFAVRTFGFVGGDGILGVCFGNVITVNSPGGLGAKQTNWETTLWHEYAHTVTLGTTKNRIPRWLTEGISVYEEGLRDPAARRRMTPEYRARLSTDDGLIPLDELNQAFVRPKTPDMLMFAYFQSGMIVEFILGKYGDEALRNVLKGIGGRQRFTDAMDQYIASLDKLEKEFKEFAGEEAAKIGKDLDWERPGDDLSLLTAEEVRDWLKKNPDNYWGITSLANELINEEEYEEAEKVLEELVQKDPGSSVADNAYLLLARAYRRADNSEKEIAALEKALERSSDNMQGFLRLMKLNFEQENWEAVAKTGRRAIAVNPFVTTVQRYLGESQFHLGQTERAIATFRKLLAIGADNPSQTHYRLAQLLHETDREAAKRHVLDALAASPRFRDAHTLLMKLQSPAS